MPTATTTLSVPADDPMPTVEWEVVHRDMFDRDSPATTEVAGSGLLRGLVELWARFLGETTHDGQRGFSDFTLYTRPLMVGIYGDMKLAQRIKDWVFPDKTSGTGGVLDRARLDILQAIARVHAPAIEAAFAEAHARDAWLSPNKSEAIFDAAASASSADDFLSRLR